MILIWNFADLFAKIRNLWHNFDSLNILYPVYGQMPSKELYSMIMMKGGTSTHSSCMGVPHPRGEDRTPLATINVLLGVNGLFSVYGAFHFQVSKMFSKLQWQCFQHFTSCILKISKSSRKLHTFLHYLFLWLGFCSSNLQILALFQTYLQLTPSNLSPISDPKKLLFYPIQTSLLKQIYTLFQTTRNTHNRNRPQKTPGCNITVLC